MKFCLLKDRLLPIMAALALTLSFAPTVAAEMDPKIRAQAERAVDAGIHYLRN